MKSISIADLYHAVFRVGRHPLDVDHSQKQERGRIRSVILIAQPLVVGDVHARLYAPRVLKESNQFSSAEGAHMAASLELQSLVILKVQQLALAKVGDAENVSKIVSVSVSSIGSKIQTLKLI